MRKNAFDLNLVEINLNDKEFKIFILEISANINLMAHSGRTNHLLDTNFIIFIFKSLNTEYIRSRGRYRRSEFVIHFPNIKIRRISTRYHIIVMTINDICNAFDLEFSRG